MEPEPQKNGKTINWCTVDVGDANGTGEPQGIVCGAHNFAPGDLVVVVLPGGGAARRLRDHRAQDLRPRLRRDDLLAPPSSVSATTTTASSCCPPTPVSPATTPSTCCGLRDDVIEFEINPDRAYALSLRGVAREAALAYGGAFHDPAERDVPAARRRRLPGAGRGPRAAARSSSPGPSPASTRPPRRPTWMAAASGWPGMRPISLAVDVTNYVMLETGRPIHGYDADKLQGPIGVRRARDGERLTTLDGTDRTLSTEDLVVTDDSGIIGLGGVMGGETTEMSATTTRVLVEAAHWDAVSMFRTGTPAQAHLRGRQAQRARRRPDDLRGRGRPGGRAARRRTAAAPSSPASPSSGTPPRAAADHDRRRPPRPGHRHGHRRRRPRSPTCAPSAARSPRTAATLTATVPPWRPDLTDPFDLVEEVARDRRLRPACRRCCRPPPSGRGLTREPGAAPPGRPHPRRRRVRRGRSASRSSGTHDLDRLGLAGRRRRGARLLRLANPLSAASEPSMTTTLLPGLLEAAGPQRRSRRSPTSRSSRSATVTLPRGTTAGARSCGVDRRPTEGEWDDLQKALPEQPLHLAVVADRRARAQRLVGRRPTRPVERRRRRRPLGRPTRSASRSTSAPPPARRGTPAAAPRCVVGDRVVGHAGELHPQRLPGVRRCRPATVAAEVDLDVLLEHAATSPPGPGVLLVPGGQGGRRPRRRRRRAASPTLTATLREGAGDAAGVGAALRRLHRRAGRRGQALAGLRAALPGAGPDADRARRSRPPATPRSPWPPSATGRRSAPSETAGSGQAGRAARALCDGSVPPPVTPIHRSHGAPASRSGRRSGGAARRAGGRRLPSGRRGRREDRARTGSGAAWTPVERRRVSRRVRRRRQLPQPGVDVVGGAA